MRLFRLSTMLLFTTILLTAGCGYKDLDKRFFVVAIGIDQGESDKKYKVTLEFGIPSAKIEPGRAKSQIISQESNTISEAIRLIKSKVDKELDFGHTKIFIIEKNVAEKDIVEPLDWAFRRRDIQRVAFMAICSSSAVEILTINPPSERVPSNSLFLSFDREGTESSYIVTAFLFDFYSRLKEPGKDPFLPIIDPIKDSYQINKTALFDKNKMKLTLNPDETRIFNTLLRKRNQKEDIRIDKGDIHFSLEMTNLGVKCKFKKDNHQKTYMDVVLNISGIVEESKGSLFNKNWKEYEEAAGIAIQERCLNLLKKLQKNNVDPLGFGLDYRAISGSKTAWEDWKKMYPKIEFKVHANVKIKSTGIID